MLTNELATGLAAGEACAQKAERVADFDREGAARFILGQLRRHGQISGEDLTADAVAHGFRCHDLRAYGPVFASLKRQGLIVRVGWCTRRRGNGTAGGSIYAAT